MYLLWIGRCWVPYLIMRMIYQQTERREAKKEGEREKGREGRQKKEDEKDRTSATSVW